VKPIGGDFEFFRRTGAWRFGLGVSYGSFGMQAPYEDEADSGQRWTVPVILQLSKVTRLGPFPFSMGIAAGYYVEEPGSGPKWKLRMLFAVLLPRSSPHGAAK
jgi:hypothetical protein